MTDEQSGINEERYSYGEVCRQRDAWRNRAEVAESGLKAIKADWAAREADLIDRAKAAEKRAAELDEWANDAVRDVWVTRVVRERAELDTKVRELKARAEAAEKRVAELDADVAFLSEQIERHVALGIRLGERAEVAEKCVKELEAVLERIANESKDYQYVARAALEAKP